MVPEAAVAAGSEGVTGVVVGVGGDSGDGVEVGVGVGVEVGTAVDWGVSAGGSLSSSEHAGEAMTSKTIAISGKTTLGLLRTRITTPELDLSIALDGVWYPIHDGRAGNAGAY